MEEGILHIKLVNRPTTRESQGKHCANVRWFDHRTEGLSKIDTWALSESTKNPTRLVPLERPVSVELVLEDPFVGAR